MQAAGGGPAGGRQLAHRGGRKAAQLHEVLNRNALAGGGDNHSQTLVIDFEVQMNIFRRC